MTPEPDEYLASLAPEWILGTVDEVAGSSARCATQASHA